MHAGGPCIIYSASFGYRPSKKTSNPPCCPAAVNFSTIGNPPLFRNRLLGVDARMTPHCPRVALRQTCRLACESSHLARSISVGDPTGMQAISYEALLSNAMPSSQARYGVDVC